MLLTLIFHNTTAVKPAETEPTYICITECCFKWQTNMIPAKEYNITRTGNELQKFKHV